MAACVWPAVSSVLPAGGEKLRERERERKRGREEEKEET